LRPLMLSRLCAPSRAAIGSCEFTAAARNGPTYSPTHMITQPDSPQHQTSCNMQRTAQSRVLKVQELVVPASPPRMIRPVSSQQSGRYTRPTYAVFDRQPVRPGGSGSASARTGIELSRHGYTSFCTDAVVPTCLISRCVSGRTRWKCELFAGSRRLFRPRVHCRQPLAPQSRASLGLLLSAQCLSLPRGVALPLTVWLRYGSYSRRLCRPATASYWMPSSVC
jgi:hypothetical protein